MTPAELLAKARALIANESDWRQGLESETNGGYCAAESIWVAAGFDAGGRKVTDDERQIILDAREMLRLAVGADSIVEFNDDPLTRHADVLAAFDRAAKDAQ